MKPEEKEHLKKVIIKKIEALKKSLVVFKDLSQPVCPDNAIGRLTRMEAINSKAINEASFAKSKQTLTQLVKSLERIKRSDFGYCSNCEEPIPYKRLLIMPEAPFCVLCAGKIDDR